MKSICCVTGFISTHQSAHIVLSLTHSNEPKRPVWKEQIVEVHLKSTSTQIRISVIYHFPADGRSVFIKILQTPAEIFQVFMERSQLPPTGGAFVSDLNTRGGGVLGGGGVKPVCGSQQRIAGRKLLL